MQIWLLTILNQNTKMSKIRPFDKRGKYDCLRFRIKMLRCLEHLTLLLFTCMSAAVYCTLIRRLSWIYILSLFTVRSSCWNAALRRDYPAKGVLLVFALIIRIAFLIILRHDRWVSFGWLISIATYLLLMLELGLLIKRYDLVILLVRCGRWLILDLTLVNVVRVSTL